MLTRIQSAVKDTVRREWLLLLLILAVSWSAAVRLYQAPELRKTYPGFPKEIAERVPNNGEIPTTFLVHVAPYYVFGEDFYLYYVRAKRILEFGWVDNVLEPNKNTGKDFRNAVQVLICAIPALFGYHIQHLAFIYLIYLSIGIYIVYRVSSRWMSQAWFAFLITGVLFITLNERILRLSTYTLSMPTLIAGVSSLLGIYLAMREGRALTLQQKILPISLLCILSLWDAWAFGVLFCMTACVAAEAFYRGRKKGSDKEAGKLCLFALIAGAGLYKGVSYAIHPDVMERAGFHNLNLPDLKWMHFPELLLWFVILGGVLYFFKKRNEFFHFFILSGASLLLILSGMIFVLRIESFALSHFYYLYRLLWIWIFGAALSSGTRLFNPGEVNLGKALETNTTLRKGLILAVLLAFAGFWAYHSNQLLASAAFYPTFAKTKRFEKLSEFIRTNIPEQRGKSLLTLSHEANYLLAYETKFDLLLPEGFSLHSRKTNWEIVNRFMAVSHFLNLPPQKWEVFLEPNHPRDQSLWGLSRVISERAGYLYYFFSRFSMRPEFTGPNGEQAALLKAGMIQQMPANPSQFDRLPDYILREEVMEFMKPQIPSVYDKIYEQDGMTLYRSKYLRS